jgi:site-specific DNA recombinase
MEKQMKAAAIYARVSSDKQMEEKTIASQIAALTEAARKEGYDVPREWIFRSTSQNDDASSAYWSKR